MPWTSLHMKSRILLPECTSSSQFSPRHPCSPLAAEYLISWRIYIINLYNRNSHYRIIRPAFIISITLLKSIKSIRSTLIFMRWEFCLVSRQNKGNNVSFRACMWWLSLLGGTHLNRKDYNWLQSCYELCIKRCRKKHILLHEAKKTCCWNQL